ncbi:MAG: helix-turn-helix domain-containing protein [Enterococcus sp.]
MTVLLLTKSYSYEQDFVKKLNDLGYEVLCSNQVLLDLQSTDKEEFSSELDYFDTVILSETISDQEVATCLETLKLFRCRLIRKTITDLDEEAREQWGKRGIEQFVSQEVSFEELREQMAVRKPLEQKSKPSMVNEKDFDLENFDYRLTKQEYRVFRLLKQSIGKCISRTEMCYFLWESAPSRAKESRLSGIIKSLKKKMAEHGLDETQLQTSWGNGYCLKRIVSKKASFTN